MKQISPVEWLYQMLSNPNRRPSERIKILEKAKKMEKENMINIINCYHNNLFFIPLKEDGESERIFDLILTGEIKSKLEK